jgi:hypothetical protein
MLGTPKALGDGIEGKAVSQVKPACPEETEREELVGASKRELWLIRGK